MLDVFLKQSAKKIIVGDIHQQIYGWRYAINSLQQVDFPIYPLSHSFRFDEEIALIANRILLWKKHLHQPAPIKIIGAGNPTDVHKTRTVLGRTNLALLLSAISKWQQSEISKLFFEGNINTYTFAEEGASLYDVLNLYNGKTDRIRDKLIAEMHSLKDLEEYIQKTEDSSLSMIVEIVKEFGNKLPSLINELKTHHTTEKEEADLIFSTVHRCKGMEYDEVTLLNDFITEEKLKRNVDLAGGEKMNESNKNKLAEEINTLYVAATRARNKLILPPEINPLKSIGISSPVQSTIIPEKKSYTPEFEQYWQSNKYNHRSYGRSYNEIKGINYGKKWAVEEREELLDLFRSKIQVKKIAEKLGRTPYSVKRKLMDLGIEEDDIH